MNPYSYSTIILVMMFYSCSHSQNTPESNVDKEDSLVILPELKDNRTDVDKAMDALNEIQVNGDGGIVLYLTFPNISHKECTGEISTYEISAKQFHDALISVMAMNNHSFSVAKSSQLAALASHPWEKYTVTVCGGSKDTTQLINDSLPIHQGTWIIKEIFGVSDLLINW